MFSLSTVLTLLGAAFLVRGAPTDPDIALARKFAPQWRFHKDEIYWPSTVEYFLSGVKLFDGNGNAVAGQPASLTTQNLDDMANQGDGLFLSTDINSGKGGFLRGQNPSNSSPKVYTFIAKKANGVVDLFYWMFTPFNQAKSVPLLGQVGDHVGDWERITVRTVSGEPTQVDYHAHSDTGSGTIPWAQVLKFDNGARPVGYVAQGSHGFWASAGTFTYVNAVIFKLQDLTSDGGVSWDTRDALVPLSYPDTYTGNSEWLNYKGKWGNKGTTNCWWSIFYKECEIVDGPGGPLRGDVLGAAKVGNNFVASSGTTGQFFKSKMQGPLSQTLGTASTESTSKYTFHVSFTTADKESYPNLAVEQRCVELSEDGKNSTTLTTFASVELTDAKEFTVAPDACPQGLVSSYTVGVCAEADNTNCSWSSETRNLRAFSADPSVLGIQDVTAIVVDDLDDWEL